MTEEKEYYTYVTVLVGDFAQVKYVKIDDTMPPGIPRFPSKAACESFLKTDTVRRKRTEE